MADKSAQNREFDAFLSGFIPALILSCAVNVALGLCMVLVSIERTELGYNVRKLENMMNERSSRNNELEVERGRLLSPYQLERKAANLGLRAAKPGQIRRVGEASANAAQDVKPDFPSR
ncbi:hypothetical protein FACS1894206_00490 [Deltaproteobacteria bacterium]|nr:hypothetical protein FACS1894206_00490 [Deltaproteobacteria bacterium]